MTRILCAVLNAVRLQTDNLAVFRRFSLLPAVPVLVLALAACAGDDAPRPMHLAAQMTGDTVRLDVREIPPDREILALLLVDPAGRETPARDRELITREESSGGNAGPGVGVGASGGSSSGIRPYISLGYLFRGDDDVRRSKRLTASIPLTDTGVSPAAYAEYYRDWRVVVRYRDRLEEAQQVSIPAPPPSP